MADALEKAQQRNAQFAVSLKSIRSNDDLSEEGKLRRIARLWREHHDAIRKLREEREVELNRERERLQRRVFGPMFPAFATETERIAVRASYRDALDRAERAAKPDDAVQLLDRAGRTEDKLMARAVATIAAERGWGGVLQVYADQHPGVDGGATAELTAFQEALSSRTRKFAESMTFSSSMPRELSRLGTGQIDQFANEADSAPAA